MFRIPHIQRGEFYINQAMSEMQVFAQKSRKDIDKRFFMMEYKKEKDKMVINLDKRKDLELEKLRFLNKKIDTLLKRVINSFPNFYKTEKIYQDLIDTGKVSVKEINDNLNHLKAILFKIDELTQTNEWKIKKSRNQNTLNFIMKKHLGKVNSYFTKNKQVFEQLALAGQFMSKLPTLRKCFTVAIAGFPNVGKSTLMNKLTGSQVEIQNYPFTTKGLMFGYITEANNDILQLIDTPGLLGREKNNSIEQRAQIVLHQFCDIIVFILDATETCGYNLDQQIGLLKNTARLEKQLIIYLSKSDIYNEEDEEKLQDIKKHISKYLQFRESSKLKEHLLETQKKNKKFDASKIQTLKN